MIHIDGKAFQPLKKILAKDQLLELAGLDPKRHEIVLIDGEGKAHQIDGDFRGGEVGWKVMLFRDGSKRPIANFATSLGVFECTWP